MVWRRLCQPPVESYRPLAQGPLQAESSSYLQEAVSVPNVSLIKSQLVLFQKRTELILKRNSGMVFSLLSDVGAHGLQIRGAHGKSSVSRLPCEFFDMGEPLLNKKVGTPLEFLHQIGLGYAAPQLDQNVNMIGNTAYQNGRAIEVFGDSSQKSVNLPTHTLVRQKRKPVFRGKDDV